MKRARNTRQTVGRIFRLAVGVILTCLIFGSFLIVLDLFSESLGIHQNLWFWIPMLIVLGSLSLLLNLGIDKVVHWIHEEMQIYHLIIFLLVLIGLAAAVIIFSNT